ncbi:TIR domain-containing protein [Telluribacter sp.]|jgi:Leucine-rich repeat (LRR) protein|uniref:TIR domain-containing protein n=1 Tax=Telluribacter sp. TaxID=1978767 RepID=UPI002E138BCA|nr:TIR domain-containing protein [Telluribacter sp.]
MSAMRSESNSDNFPPLKVFISYSHKDREVKRELENYLASYKDQLVILSDDLVSSGSNWEQAIKDLRSETDVFLLLVSESYLSSTPVNKLELPHIVDRSTKSFAYTIPVILQQCNWQQKDFSKFQSLPKSGPPLEHSESKDAAYYEVVDALLSIRQLKLNSYASKLISEAKETRSESLELSGCDLQRIPWDLLEMSWIKALYLNKNSIKKIENLERLENLELLELAQNEIEHISGLDRLKNLRFLDLEYNKIKSVENLDSNISLTMLGLSSNAIESLAGISQLKQLKTLYIGHNKLRSIQELSDLPQLDRVTLTNNKIKSIKPLLGHIRKGLNVALHYSYNEDEKGIFIKDNPTLAEPSVEVIQQGRDAILKYFGDADTYGTKKLEILKLILVGNSRVGKTNLSEFLRGQALTPIHNSTHLLDIQPWDATFLTTESGKPMRVNIFDFGGQDYYHDSHRMYYSHDTAYILLWDTVTNKYSEEQEKGEPLSENFLYENFPLEYWLESIRYNLTDKFRHDFSNGSRSKSLSKGLISSAPVLVLQNKIDIAEGALNQCILVGEYENVSLFFNVSLRTGKRVKILFDVLSDYLNSLNLSGRELIDYEYRIIEDYLSHPRSFKVVTLDEFREECIRIVDQENIDFNLDNAKIIAEILNSIGVLFYSSLGSNGIIYTDIRRLNELIKEVMDVAKKGSENGIFRLSQVQYIPNIDEILQLLVKNKSIIPISGTEYLAPQFLPVKPSASIAFFLHAFTYYQVQFVYKAYFHKTLLLSLFAEYLSSTLAGTDANVTGLPFWRNGIIISEGEGPNRKMVYVEFEKTEAVGLIKLKTISPYSKTGLERKVENSIEKLSQGWTYCKEVSVNGVDFFEEKDLQHKAELGQYEIAATSGRVYNINDFKHIVDFKSLPSKLFISYSSRNAEFIKRFVTHLEILRASGQIVPWYDRMIESGTRWDDTIRAEMKNADVVVFLLSPDFLATEYIMKTEIPLAIEQMKNERSKFFFIELQPCGWKRTILSEFQQTDDPNQAGKNIISIGNPENDAQWNLVVDELEKKIAEKRNSG